MYKNRKERKSLGFCSDCPNKSVNGYGYCKSCLVKRRDKNREIRSTNKKDVISHYGGQCSCCGEERLEFLTIDHINNDGAIHKKEVGGSGDAMYRWIKKNKYPKNRFQILCYNCNYSKGFMGYCPHKKEKQYMAQMEER